MSVPNLNLTLANAYSCSSTSSAQHTDTQSGVSGRSGSCATSSSAATSSKLAGDLIVTESGPNISGRDHLAGTSNGLEAAFSLSSGGAQSSCSSGSASSSTGVIQTSTSISKPGSCEAH